MCKFNVKFAAVIATIQMKKILVLCTGNACRSQMAEGYLRFFTHGAAEIVSAGLSPRGVHPLAIKVMQHDNIDISDARSKHVDEFSGEYFDYLITVCKNAEEHRPADIKANYHVHYDIPDPEAETEEELLAVFEETRERIKRDMLRFIGSKNVDLRFREKTNSELQ
jgi:arsenate reductase